ncbi:hypothetical protein J2T20_002810 [Paenibacillus wynnii]|nr:hypothetical protein [Paenibacillus wynnii]
MRLLKGIFRFFVPAERTLLFTTFDQAQYYKIKKAFPRLIRLRNAFFCHYRGGFLWHLRQTG